ncbi:DNA-binding response regulator, NarL/FixJ family, contains REC and HTH domains [Micromonospora pallida]|uniref:DNA-binding response regulator, NarL/FixJ family, contains REC and HTH domains n=1 Tax=Micromonospora pallida TaxID=145854 RepID=A0A1C6TGN8_9ACTN|nr:response regulator transcription factor [Micromonospora pallida]SCL40931.1 DNA-binding response regulator, NarL/FixJ family, contains REC and HTH domains [Micromonospora pallida]
MRIVLVEDQPLLRDVLAEALTARGLHVVGTAGDAATALLLAERLSPEVMLLDIRLPPTFLDEGLRVAEEVRRRHPGVALLVLSSYAEVAFASRLLSMEADTRSVGYLLKDRVGEIAELVAAIRRVAAGEVVIDRHLIQRLMVRPRIDNPLDRLSPHERRILALVAEGRSNLGIAEQMECQVSTVEKHLSTITGKLRLTPPDARTRRGVNVRVLATLAFLTGVNSTSG